MNSHTRPTGQGLHRAGARRWPAARGFHQALPPQGRYSLRAVSWRVNEAARRLGLSRSALYRKIKEHQLRRRWGAQTVLLLIRREDPGNARIVELLTRHVARARAETAPGSAHALDVAQLRSADVSFFAAWDADTLLGVGALRRLAPDHGEVKSMYTAEEARRRGVATAILERLIAEARGLGLRRLSLETGSWDYFAPARELYRCCGFRECGPFADYRPDPNSVFMTLQLYAPPTPP